ncbi:Secretory phospholipase A2 receptor [Merluccius polli]|uniref:Secretory phospholipase A2 receptor n=1 Tax=Merluccius polli TaxID=89951 RepID=A0AA47P6W3_MERPO|nr:Secretory phospholipase A2 receptor [Merluccius polli]
MNLIKESLHKHNKLVSWSNRKPWTFHTDEVHIINNLTCVTIDINKWEPCKCHENKTYFMCYSTANYHLIEKENDWCEALTYCRKHYIDLASINNKQVIESGANKTFWFGLMNNQWMWSAGQCCTFSNKNEVGTNRDCGAVRDEMRFYLCYSKDYTCMKGNKRIIYHQDRLTWEEAFDYCNKNHNGLLFISGNDTQKIVEQVLNVTVKDGGPFWIGLRQSRLFGFWIWATIDKVVEYQNWENGTTPKKPLSYHCGAIEGKQSYTWKHVDCQTKLPVLCVKDMNKTFYIMPPVTTVYTVQDVLEVILNRESDHELKSDDQTRR